MILKQMKILEKLILVKEMIIQLILCLIILISKKHKMIVMDLSKQQALDADPSALQQINFTANLDRAGECFSLLRKQRWIYINDSI